MEELISSKISERGGAGIKLLLALLGLILIANAGYNFVPVAYQGENFKQEMDGAVVKGTALPAVGKPPVDTVRKRLFEVVARNEIPDDAIIEVKQQGKTITGYVSYSREVQLLPFGLYVYTYNFEHTSAPSGFLIKES